MLRYNKTLYMLHYDVKKKKKTISAWLKPMKIWGLLEGSI